MQSLRRPLFLWCALVLAGVLSVWSIRRVLADAAPAYAIGSGVWINQSYGDGSLVSGYATVLPALGTTTPPGVAIFGFRQGGVLVSETGVPATPALSSGRIYAEVASPVDTGLAIATPGSTAATITFYFTDASGNPAGSGSTTVPANQHIAGFLDQAPFKAYTTPAFQGTFSFTATAPVAVVALRGLTNERGEFLMSTLPVIDTSVAPKSGVAVIPHFADGGGWTTQVLLVNPTDSPISGSLTFFDQSGAPLAVTIGGQTATNFNYSVPMRTSQKLATSGSAATVASGSIQVAPANNGVAPTPLVLFSYRPAGITVSEAGVPVTSGAAFRMFVESAGTSGQSGSIQSGIAVANTSSSAASVTFSVTSSLGSPVIGSGPVTINLPAQGQTSKFLSDLFPNLGALQGMLRITTTSSSLSVVGLRTRINERGDFLITTTPPAVESDPASTAPVYFPHVVDGGGYTTLFALLGIPSNQTIGGAVRIYKNDGSPFNMNFTGAPVVGPWTWEGVRGIDDGDVSVIQLKDGRWRTFGNYLGSVGSEISPDGIAWAREPGIRIQNESLCGHPRAMVLDDGRVRIYCNDTTGIRSYISSDEGVTTTLESGMRILNSDANVQSLTAGGVVRTQDGHWRMYFSEALLPGVALTPTRVFSALSDDLLTWAVESGVRIGPGATAGGTATVPTVIANPDG